MECPRCKARIERLRTIDKGNSVIRYSRCSKCGERVKSIELYLVDYQAERADSIRRMVRAETEARQLTLNLETIRGAFQHLHDAVLPLQEAQDRAEPVSSVPARYTKTYRNGRGQF